MASEGKNVGKPHFQHQDKANTQSRIMIANHAARSSKREFQNIQGMLNNQMDGVSKHEHNDLQECQKIQGMLNNQMDKVSKQQHNDVQGMTLKNKNVGKTQFQLQDETNTQPLILIDNHTTRNSKERVYHTRELENMVTSGKDCQSIQGASRNQIDEASNQKDIELQGLTSRITFNNNPHVENDFMDEESDQDVDSESESLDAEKKTRGPTFMKEIWGRPSTLPRIKIRCDDMGRPIGSRRNKFTDFLGTLARNGKFCPIDVEDWHKMPMDSKKKILDVIKIIEMLLNNFIIK
ncbi:uncharacterized protein [Primulina huaijiensis]|uniref:uncharacterized protein isoform X12 n=1 Tax=Primulina huaijiensis TaxID=1492673 RepID=UPI003CC76160